jgi:hypothetical protein
MCTKCLELYVQVYPYPSDEELQADFEGRMQWDFHKTNVVSHAVQDIQWKRGNKHDARLKLPQALGYLCHRQQWRHGYNDDVLRQVDVISHAVQDIAYNGRGVTSTIARLKLRKPLDTDVTDSNDV